MTPQPPPRSVYDLHTFYLSPEMVTKPTTLTISSVTIDQVFNPRINKPEPFIVLHFIEAKRALKCNKTQSQTMMELTGTDQFEQWTGARIILKPAKASNGKATLDIAAATPKPEAPPKP